MKARTSALLLGLSTILAGCISEIPGGETGPFAPGNEMTFFYQSVLTDPPETAQIVLCENQLFDRSCIRLANAATFQLEATETGVTYGNDEIRITLQQDPGGVPSGIGQYANVQTGDTRGFRWVSLPRRAAAN